MDHKEEWREVLSHIQLSISRTHFKAWFSNSFLKDVDDSTVTIAVKNKIAKEYFENEFYDIVKESIEQVVGKGKKIIFVVEAKPKEKTKDETVPPLFEGEKNLEVLEEADYQGQYIEAVRLLGINPKYTFENFIVGVSNRLAHAAAYAVAQNPGYTYNPLFIYGDVGLGKTHLIQAIANSLLLKDPTFKIMYSSSELFLNEMVSAIRSGNAEAFRRKYREKSLLIIDDIQFIESKKGTQEEIFHTFNSMYQYNKQIVIVSDRPPEDMPFLEARLRSRFEGGMVVDINKPEYETRLAILQKKTEEKGYSITSDVLDFIAQNYTSNIRELEGILMKLGGLHSIGKETITIGDAARILGPKISKKTLRLKPNDIISAVCDSFNISTKELKSPIRTDRVAKTRQIAMYLLRIKLNLSYLEVAHILNRKDHTTVIHAVEKIEHLQLLDEDLRYQIQEITRILER
jgi:chromosomal replication initiator protein